MSLKSSVDTSLSYHVWRTWSSPSTSAWSTSSTSCASCSCPAQIATILAKGPRSWFAQIETLFTTQGITVSYTKFDYIVASLSSEFATEVCDLLLCSPEEDPYDRLKTKLTKCTSASEQCCLQELLSAEELGDKMPSQVLRCIQQLLSSMANTMDATLLRELSFNTFQSMFTWSSPL